VGQKRFLQRFFFAYNCEDFYRELEMPELSPVTALSSSIPQEVAPPEDHTARNLAVAGAAGASPFLGLIGQSPLRDLRDARQYKAPLSLLADLQEGDVVLQGLPKGEKGNLYNTFVQKITGSPYMHAEIKTPEGFLSGGGRYSPELEDKYKNLVVLRAKDGQGRQLAEEAMRRGPGTYSHDKSISAAIKDIFLPKIRKSSTGNIPSCEGKYCTTPAGEAAEQVLKERVTRGQSAHNLSAADFLRKDSPFEVRGYLGDLPPSKARQLATKLIPRAALGAGLGASVYGATQKPDIAAGAVGALTLPMLVRAALGKEHIPTASKTFGNLMHASSQGDSTSKLIKGLL